MRVTAYLGMGCLALALAGCQKTLEAPADRGVCFAMVDAKPPASPFKVLTRNVPDLEHCAAELEKMRRNFAGLGVSKTDVTGSYQGQFIFIQREGVFTAEKFDGFRFPFMVRAPDGSLVKSGAITFEKQ
jgi:hypothetical protein